MAEPVTLAEAKAQVRMTEDDSEDTFLTSLIAPARAYVERRTRRLFVGGTRTETFRQWGDYLEIWRAPITAITEVSYSTSDDPADDATYTGFVPFLGFPARVFPSLTGDFPDLIDGGTITVTYTTGAIDSTSEEYLLGKRAILLLIGYWFDNRGEIALDKDTEFAVDCLLGDISPVSAY